MKNQNALLSLALNSQQYEESVCLFVLCDNGGKYILQSIEKNLLWVIN